MDQLENRTPTEEEQAFHSDLIGIVNKHSTALTRTELLMVASFVVGSLIAHQDGEECSDELIIELVNRNIIRGNQEAAFSQYGVGGRA